ncbi:sulfur carrier protein ThiS [Pengzhenrongella sp.]|jgi:sulfur carrier protein|uniref:sulfur carrier protein ThiS n=1 Tax=Pengzhenrongella sp. TaxID=2888820 RepID=UPI002F92CF0C
MTITLNGSAREIADETTLDQLVAVFALPDSGIALAMNSQVVPRSVWAQTRVVPGARVEVVTALPGG